MLERELDSINVRKRTLNFNIIESESQSEIPALLNSVLIFFFVKILLWAAKYVIKNSDLVMWLIETRIKKLI